MTARSSRQLSHDANALGEIGDLSREAIAARVRVECENDRGIGRQTQDCLREDRTLVTAQRPGGARVAGALVRRELVVAEAVDR